MCPSTGESPFKSTVARRPVPRRALAIIGLAATLTACPLDISAQAKPPAGRASGGLPLVPTRVARFTITEGTWMSVDVSPDGHTLVFDLVGQLYTLPITGGTARALTHGLAWNGQPRFSPDGTRIVFTSDRSGQQNLWTMQVDGSDAKPLTRSTWDHGVYQSPAWSPDGRTVVATKVTGPVLYGPLDLIRVDVRTGIETSITGSTNTTTVRPSGLAIGDSYIGAAFGSSSDEVYVVHARGWVFEEPKFQLVRLNLTNHREIAVRGRRTLSLSPQLRPALSRDGRYFAYAVERDAGGATGLRLLDRKTGAEKWLVPRATDHAGTIWTQDLFPGYAFTPDSRALVLSYGGKLHCVDLATGVDRIIQFVAQVDQPLGPLVAPHFAINDSVVRVRGVSHPALSPDGQQLAFSALGKIWVMDLPRGKPRRLTPTPRAAPPDEFNPTWSPNGSYVAYTGWSDRGGGALYRVAAAGGTPEQLTRDTARYETVAYSPDGRWLYGQRTPGGPTMFPYSHADLNRLELEHPRRRVELVRVPAGGGTGVVVTALAAHKWPEPVEPQFVSGDAERSVYVNQHQILGGQTALSRVAVQGVTEDFAEPEPEPEPVPVPVLQVLGRRDRGRQPDGAMFSSLGVPVIVSPDGRYAVAAQSPGPLYLVRLPTPLSALTTTGDPLVLRVYEPHQPAGVRIERVWGTGGDRVEWARDGSYFAYAAGPVVIKQFVNADTVTPSMLGRAERIELNLTVMADRPDGVIALRGARLLTMRGREVIERGDVVVRRNRIVAVGPSGRVTIPAGAKVVDLTGKTILPGYVDVHDHVWYHTHSILRRLPHLVGELAYGVTTLRDPSPTGTDGLATNDERVAVGDAVGPRSFSTRRQIGPPSLYGLETVEAIRSFFRLWSENYQSETVKFAGNVGWRGRRQLMAMAAQAEGLFPTNHLEGQTTMLTALLDGYGAIEHSLYDVPIYEDVAKLFAASGIVYTPTIGTEFEATSFFKWDLVPDAKQKRFTSPHRLARLFTEASPEYVPDNAHLRHLLEVPAKIAAAGGKVGVGGHGGVIGLSPHWEMWLYVKGGMPTYDALRAGTIWSAEAIGHGGDLGSLEVGKLADLQVLDRNPREDIRHTLSIRYVMKNGRLYQADDLTEIWPRHKPLDPFWWWEEQRVLSR